MPAAVRSWAAGVGGGPPEVVRDLPGGFSPGATSILEWPDRAIFVKAVGAEFNPESPFMHRREALISAALPRSCHFPRLLDSYDDGDWVGLAFDAIVGRPPRHPWDPQELEVVAGGLSTIHAELTPSPLPSLEQLDVYAGEMFGGWADLASMASAPASLDGWARQHLTVLADVEAHWPEACAGSTLVHGDVRSDNVLLGDDGVVFVDWPHGAVGNPAFDVVAWAPSVVLEGGPDPESLLSEYGPSRPADPDVITTLLAAICGFFVSRSLRPPPPGLPTLRAFQAAQGEVALAWLRRRTRWR